MAFGKLGAMGRGFGTFGALGSVRPSWVQPGAVIDEIFTTGLYWPRPITQEIVDTRASSKYLTNASGVLVSVGSNVLPISDAGMLIEPSATNLQTQSVGFSNAAVGGTGGTVTANFAAGPDLTTTASRYQWTGNTTFWNATSLGALTAGTYTISTYLKVNSLTTAASSFNHAVTDGTNSATVVWSSSLTFASSSNTGLCSVPSNPTVTALGNGYVRLSFTITLSGTVGASFHQTVLPNANVSGDILLWGSMAQSGSATSSYITTTAATAVRAADSAVIQRTGIGRIVFTFDDSSQQTVSGIDTGTQYTIPTNLNRPLITRLTGYAS